MTYEQAYKKALRQIMKHGALRANRTATAARSLFDVKLVVDVSEHYPILTSKFVDLKIINTEFEWLLTGQTNTDLFKARGIKIWDQWADDNGNLGPVYGHQLINFNSEGFNQLEKVIESIKQDPLSRRHILSLWNPLQLKEMRLPPCYLYFQFYVEDGNKLNVFVVQRSGDMFAGIPYDICVFTNMLGYISKQCGLKPGLISHNIVDAHIYQDHFKGVKEYLKRPEHVPPTWQPTLFGDVNLFNYQAEARIKIPIAK